MKYKETIGYGSNSISAATISAKMFQENPVSLNDISFLATVSLIRNVIKKINIKIDKLIVDAVGNCETYTKSLQIEFPSVSSIIVVPKADSLYKIVGAASIVAKVTRDRYMKSFNCSGYPGDKNTLNWLVSNFDPLFGFSNEVRFSWKTTKRLLNEEIEGEENKNSSILLEKPIDVIWNTEKEGNPSLRRYFQQKRKSIQSKEELLFFKRFRIENMSSEFFEKNLL